MKPSTCMVIGWVAVIAGVLSLWFNASANSGRQGARARVFAVLFAAAFCSVSYSQNQDDVPPNGRELALMSGMPCEIVSMDNANSLYQVSFTFEDSLPSDDSDIFFIRLGGAVIQESSRSRSRIVTNGVVRQSASLGFLLEGGEMADRLAGIVGCDIRRRRHPGHRVVSRIVPMESEIRSDVPSAEVTIELKNIGEESLYIIQMPFRSDQPDPAFFVFGTVGGRQAAAVGNDELYLTRGMQTVTWKPGEVLSRKVDLKKHLALDRAGVYELMGVYEMRFSERSNSMGLIWVDYVAQRWLVHIVD